MSAGWALSILVGLFLLFDGGARVVQFDPYVEGLIDLGYPEGHGQWIGLVLIAATLIYLLPWTSMLGAILLTGYLGGAVAAQVRVEEMDSMFALVMGVLVWIALLLREPSLQAYLPYRRNL